MKSKLKYLILIWSILILGIIFYVPTVLAGSACLTVNEDGVCKNVFNSKGDVYLNPYAEFGPSGTYFFVVLSPRGVSNPNDQGGVSELNLSDDYDTYSSRTFTTPAGSVNWYLGTHEVVGGVYIQLVPYSDTLNDGVYIIAVCSLENGYPVNPKDCSYNAFCIKNK